MTVIIDVRSPQEFDSGHVEGALNIPHTEIGQKISGQVPDHSTPIKLYCAAGRRAQMALDVLKGMGYTDLENLGGYEEAKAKLGK